MSRLTSGTFLHDLRTQRLRLTLTLFGIVWGTVAVVALLAFGIGLERRAQEDMGMGDNLATITAGVTSLPYRGFPPRRRIRLVSEDAAVLAAHVPEIAAISEVTSRLQVVRAGRAMERPTVLGVEPQLEGIRQMTLAPGGRFLSTLDMERQRRVAVLGSRLKEALFQEGDAVGQEILVGRSRFTVVGSVEPESGYGTGSQLFMPATTYRILYRSRYVSSLHITPASPKVAPLAMERSVELLGARHSFDPQDPGAVWVGGSHQMDEEMGLFFLGLKAFLAIVGGCTLLVGGIGVANIMFVVVRERRHEIGVKRAVGARRRDILLHFLLEAALLVALGAAFGFLIAVGLVRLLALLPFTEEMGDPVLSPSVILSTVAVLGAIAFAAGFFPARKAAHLDPVECLRG
jgi:putative ABC transport system permease protein